MTFSGIYKICSKTHPDRCYIGSAVDMYRRRREHLSYLKGNKHFSKKLQFHYNKYGKDDLEFFVVSVGSVKLSVVVMVVSSLISNRDNIFNISSVI